MFRGALQRKLLAVMLLTTLVAVVVALGAMIGYDLRTYHRGWVDDLSAQAELLGRTTAPALEFDDARVARENLSLLRQQPKIRAATVYTASGAVFATYTAEAASRPLPSLPAQDSALVEDGELLVFKHIVDQGRTLGTVHLRARYELVDRMVSYAGIALIVTIAAMLVALLVSAWLQRIITRPILAIGEVARDVVAQGDYSRRAERISADEVGSLADAFNNMLSETERRTQALEASNLDKAREVDERRVAQQEVMRLNENLQAQLGRMQLLDQITRSIGERQDLQSIYQVAIRSVEERLPVDFSCVLRYDALHNVLTVIRVGAHSQALAMELALDEQSVIGIDQNGLSRCVRGELVYEPDIEASGFAFPQRLARGGLRSMVVAPLQSESHVFGVLVAARQKPQAFSSGDCEFLRQLSSHVALAAQQAQLHGALQRAYDDLRQTQQSVMQQERLRALGQMASGIAHDINNAISPVALYTESLLEREPHLSERGRGQLVTIARAIDDVAATVARMREFYRQREPQLALTPVKLNPLIQQVVDLTQARWSDMPQQRGAVISLEMDLAADLPAILGVESEVREALINLVFNAVDAMPDGGVLSLRTRCSEPQVIDAATRYALVEVSDTGVGMDEDTRQRCLEPFFTTKGERGTGLGLAMVYGVTQRHGADVGIDSAVGRGTTVRLSFPIPQNAPSASAAPAPPQAPSSRLRILIVDDDPLLLKSLCDTLEFDGHLVVAANGGQAGIDAFRACRPAEAFDAVITDLGMPYVDGRKVAAAIKASAEAMPVILLTGWGQRLMAEGDVPSQVDRVLSKPPKLRELRAALAQLTLRTGQVAAAGSTKEAP